MPKRKTQGLEQGNESYKEILTVPDLDLKKERPASQGIPGTFSRMKNALYNSRYIQILLVLTVIAAVLRLYALDLSSLWLDEALTYRFSLSPFSDYWGLISAGGEVSPPLFFWLEHFMLYLGHTETTLRLLPAVFGILTVPVIYFLGSESVDRNAGLLAAALLAFSPFHLFYSQEARMYSLVLLFLACALYFFFRASKEEGIKWWLLFGLFSGLAFWTHFYSGLLISGVYLWYLGVSLKRKAKIPDLKGAAYSLAILVLICLPLLAISWTALFRMTSRAPTWGNRGIEVLTTTFSHFSGYSAPIAVLFVALFLIGMYMLLKTRRDTFTLFTVLFVLFLIGNVALSYLMPMAPRYFIGILPVFFIGIASSYFVVSRVKPDRRIIPICLALIILVSIPGLIHHYTVVEKEDWRYVADLLAKSTMPGDTVVVMPSYMANPFDFYYDNVSDGTREIGLSREDDLVLLTSQKQKEKIFIAFTDDLNAADPSGKAIQWMKEHAQFAGNQRGVYVFVVV
ncbi:MAG: Dolichyl-phosphate-mannose-protein mannosyltransferase [Methanoregulaceae archaeon PtaU1.Bin222]|nr:MAG: Dolichyl-phosphate-mannose-protein mannosyltransferase [Methanoregulaceae archaeon PtaU1.Bin222]